ncbi:SRPBCC domain-containing protein [Nocardia sp. NPDC005978]|uniref:SRPBCC family protein n=1 Tax=unclassified Nocardia TaxID=2637762 RepID=UPI0033A530E6
MGSLVSSREMPGTPEMVFDAIIRPSTWAQWFSIHRDFVQPPPDRLTEGATLVSRVALLGLDDELEWVVEVLDAPYRIVLLGSGNGGVRSEFTYWLRPSPEGTTLTIGGVFTGPHITPEYSATLERHGRAELADTLDRLAAVLAAGRV